MPRKKKPIQIPPPIGHNFLFSDNTLVSCKGERNIVSKIIESEFPFPKVWNIKTDLVINSEIGDCFFELDFNENGNVYIVSYSSSMIPSKDFGSLNSWCLAKGWKTPIPIESLVKGNVFFWKEIWESLLINSDYLQSRFGPRVSEQLMHGKIEEDDDEDEEDEEL